MRFAALVLALLVGGACTEPRSAQCRAICKREQECIDETGVKMPTYDEKECVAACAALEHDPDNAAKVRRHADCVHKQQACGAVLECK